MFISHLSSWRLSPRGMSSPKMAQSRNTVKQCTGETHSLTAQTLSYKAMFSGANLLTFVATNNEAEIESYLYERDVRTLRIPYCLLPPRFAGFESTAVPSHLFFSKLIWIGLLPLALGESCDKFKDSKTFIHLKPKIMQCWFLKGLLCSKTNLYFSSQ